MFVFFTKSPQSFGGSSYEILNRGFPCIRRLIPGFMPVSGIEYLLTFWIGLMMMANPLLSRPSD